MLDFLSFPPKAIFMGKGGREGARRGFTLVEMLTVIMIVMMIMTVVGLGVRNVTGAKGR